MSDREWVYRREPVTGRGPMEGVGHWMRWLSQVRKTATWAPPRISRDSPRVLMLACTALLVNCLVAPSGLAQVVPLQQPEFTLIDPNGVDLQSANAYLHATDVSIGSKAHPLTHTVYSGPDGSWTTDYPSFWAVESEAQMDSFGFSFMQIPACPGGPVRPGIYVTVILGNSSETFFTEFSASQCLVFTPTRHTGDTLVHSTGKFTYTLRDGTKVIYSGTPNFPAPVATQMIYPDGRVLTYGYDSAAQLQSVTRSDGLQLKYTYSTGFNGLVHLTGVTAINTAYEYCDPTAATCSLTMNWPKATYSFAGAPNNGMIMTATDSSGAVTVYTMDSSGRTTGIQLPSSTGGNNVTYAYCDSGCAQYSSYPFNAHASNYVRSVVRDGQLWTYSGGPAQPLSNNNNQGSGTSATYGYTSPVGSSVTVVTGVCEDSNGLFDGPHCMTVGTNPFTQLTDEQGNVFHGPGPLILSVSRPEGNTTSYAWDSRSNLTQETLNPKSGSSLSSIPLMANYDTTCTNPLTCNQPNWVQDGNQNKTYYTYNPSNGQVATVTAPAVAVPPSQTAVSPQNRYTYVQRYAWVLNASGTYVQSAQPIWVPATKSYCRTSSAATSGVGCTLAGDEVVETYEYGPDAGPNNLFLRGVAVTADGSTHRTCYGYDRFGNQISATTPNAGTASCP